MPAKGKPDGKKAGAGRIFAARRGFFSGEAGLTDPMADAMVAGPMAHPMAVMGCGGGNTDGKDAQRDGGGNDLFHGAGLLLGFSTLA